MSEVEGQMTPESEGVQGEGNETQVETPEWEVKLKQMEATNARLLEESKKYKESWQKLEAERQEKEKTELEQKGEYETLLQREREEKAKYQKNLEEMKLKTIASNTRASLANLAKDAKDIEDLLQLGNFDLIRMDEDTLTPTEESVVSFVNDLRTRKPHLFNRKISTMEDASPKGEVPRMERSVGDIFADFVKAKQQHK